MTNLPEYKKLDDLVQFKAPSDEVKEFRELAGERASHLLRFKFRELIEQLRMEKQEVAKAS